VRVGRAPAARYDDADRRKEERYCMKKTYVLDTNVLIRDPDAVHHFEDNDIVLPITVIEELDHLKKGSGEIPIQLAMRFA
jgi:uncharacterized protein YacL